MKTQANLILTQTDFEKISALVHAADAPEHDFLQEELSRAAIVSSDELPADAVSMNSKVVFKDADAGSEMEVTLVYPHEANIESNKISILAPLGSALIGLRVGQSIDWPMPNGKQKTLKVLSVLFQPETAQK